MNIKSCVVERCHQNPRLERLEDRTLPATVEFLSFPSFAAETMVTVADRSEMDSDSFTIPRTDRTATNRSFAHTNVLPINAFAQVSTGTGSGFAFPGGIPLARFYDIRLTPDVATSASKAGSWKTTLGTVSAPDAKDYGAALMLRVIPDTAGEQDGDPVIIHFSGGVDVTTNGGSTGVTGTTEFKAFADVGNGYEEIFTKVIDAQDLIQGRVTDERNQFLVEAEIGSIIQIGGFAERLWQIPEGGTFSADASVVIGLAVTPPPDLEPLNVQWNTDRRPTPELFDKRGLDYSYRLDRPDLTRDTDIAFYWANGPLIENKIAEASELGGTRPIIPANQFADTHGPFNTPAHWGRPPQGTTHVLVVVDPDNKIAESNEMNNVVAIRLHSATDILTGSVLFNGNPPDSNGVTLSGTIGGEFIPGQSLGVGLTLSEAEVALGVDHFNWRQQIITVPPESFFKNLNTGQIINLPAYDPFVRGVHVTADHKEVAFFSPRIGQSDLSPLPVDEFIFYLHETDLPSPDVVTIPGVPQYSHFTGPGSLFFEDTPIVPVGTYGPGEFRQFRTTLTGVDRNHNPVELPIRIDYRWKTNAEGANLAVTGGGVFDVLVTESKSSGDFAVAPGPGSVPFLSFRDSQGFELFSVMPFGTSFKGGLRTAVGDLTGDGINDLLAAAGPGGGPTVVAYDGFSGQELTRFNAFEDSFAGGLFVTLADFNGDGVADVVASPDMGGGPRVRVFDGRTLDVVADFFGIEDMNFRGGVRVGTGDLNGDGVFDLIVGAGFGGGPRLAIFDGRSLGSGGPVKLLPDFFVFEQALRNGVFVTAGDVSGDGTADLIVGAGPGGGPRVFGLDGRGLLDGVRTQVVNFFAGDPNGRDGVRVAARDLDADGRADLIVGPGPNIAPRVTTYLAANIPVDGTPGTTADFLAFDSAFLGGVFVG